MFFHSPKCSCKTQALEERVSVKPYLVMIMLKAKQATDWKCWFVNIELFPYWQDGVQYTSLDYHLVYSMPLDFVIYWYGQVVVVGMAVGGDSRQYIGDWRSIKWYIFCWLLLQRNGFFSIVCTRRYAPDTRLTVRTPCALVGVCTISPWSWLRVQACYDHRLLATTSAGLVGFTTKNRIIIFPFILIHQHIGCGSWFQFGYLLLIWSHHSSHLFETTTFKHSWTILNQFFVLFVNRHTRELLTNPPNSASIVGTSKPPGWRCTWPCSPSHDHSALPRPLPAERGTHQRDPPAGPSPRGQPWSVFSGKCSSAMFCFPVR